MPNILLSCPHPHTHTHTCPPGKRPPLSRNTYELFLPPEIRPRKPHSDVALCTPNTTLFSTPRLRSRAVLAPPSRCDRLATRRDHSFWRSGRLRTLRATEHLPVVARGRPCGLTTRQGARPGKKQKQSNELIINCRTESEGNTGDHIIEHMNVQDGLGKFVR